VSQDLEQELREMANALSHDLRAPLRAIDGFSRALGEECQGNLTPRGQEYLKWISESVHGMGRQIEALVSTARLSVAELRWQTLDVTALAQQIAAVQDAAHPRLTVEVEIASGMQATADSRLLGVVLESLMQNAWVFSGQTAQARVEVGCQLRQLAGQTRPVFFVRDNGLGFSASQAERLFQPFSRLHTPDQAPVGLGMGLCKARRATSRMGGEIWAEGSPGQGATFYFTIGSPAAESAG
jgi:light-regulated signal transduction histidine kinase (bacteriophytochrome)